MLSECVHEQYLNLVQSNECLCQLNIRYAKFKCFHIVILT